jgi:hypothetical protein
VCCFWHGVGGDLLCTCNISDCAQRHVLDFTRVGELHAIIHQTHTASLYPVSHICRQELVLLQLRNVHPDLRPRHWNHEHVDWISFRDQHHLGHVDGVAARLWHHGQAFRSRIQRPGQHLRRDHPVGHSIHGHRDPRNPGSHPEPPRVRCVPGLSPVSRVDPYSTDIPAGRAVSEGFTL